MLFIEKKTGVQINFCSSLMRVDLVVIRFHLVSHKINIEKNKPNQNVSKIIQLISTQIKFSQKKTKHLMKKYHPHK